MGTLDGETVLCVVAIGASGAERAAVNAFYGDAATVKGDSITVDGLRVARLVDVVIIRVDP